MNFRVDQESERGAVSTAPLFHLVHFWSNYGIEYTELTAALFDYSD